jgi:hypothetical protein
MGKLEKDIIKLQKMFPKISGIREGEGWGAGKGTIHLGDAAEGGQIDNMPAADYYNGHMMWRDSVNDILNDALEDMGYYYEWWDAGTLIAYKED